MHDSSAMRSPLQATLLLALGASPGGCLKLNPGFDAPGGSPDTGSTTGSGVSTDVPTATGASLDPPTGSTGAEASTGGDTSGDVSTGAVEPSSTGMSSGTGETTGGPSDCWDQPLDAFAVESLLPELAGAGSPSLSPDGLDLYFKSPVMAPDLYEVRRLSRPAPEDAFVGPSVPFFSPSDTLQLDYPDVYAGATRIVFTQSDGAIYMARQSNGTWLPWKIAGPIALLDPEHRHAHSHATEDGSLLVFQREDGPGFGPLDKSFNFYQADYEAQNDLYPGPPTKITPTGPDLVLPLCPVISPDGLHLLFTAKDAGGEMQAFNDGSLGVWYTRRAAHGAAWDPPIRSAVLREVGWITCPTSITADGCQATMIRFTHPSTTQTLHLARRG